MWAVIVIYSTYLMQSDHIHGHHNDQERAESRGEGDILSPSKSKTASVVIDYDGGIVNPAAVSFGIDNLAVSDSVENELDQVQYFFSFIHLHFHVKRFSVH